MTEPIERRIALFIDFENLVTNTAISPATFDLRPALDRLSGLLLEQETVDGSVVRSALADTDEHGPGS